MIFKNEDRFSLLKVIILLVLSLLFFSSSIAGLFNRWFANGTYYSHGPFVFVVFFWLIKRKLNETPAEETMNSRLFGSAIIIFSILLNTFGIINEISTFQCLGIYFFIIGNSILFLGEKFVYQNTMIYIYLLLAIPFPSFLIDQLTFQLKLFATSLSESVLSVIYPSTVRYGNTLKIDNHFIAITNACSGLQNIFGMFSLVWLLALLQSKKNIAIIDYLISIPAAIVSNIIRIVLVCVIVVNGYGQFALVDYHEEIGLFVFLIIFIFLSLFNEIPLNWSKSPDKNSRSFQFIKSKYVTLYIISMAIMAVISIGISFNDRNILSESDLVRDRIPKKIKNWDSHDYEFGENYFNLLGTKDLLMRTYTKKIKGEKKKTVYLYVTHSKKSRSALMHRPELCLSGEGYDLIKHDEINLQNGNLNIPVHRMLFARDGKGLLVYYWYRLKGKSINSYFFHQLLYLNSKNRKSGGSMIRLSKIVDLRDTESGERILKQFVREAVPEIMKFL